MFGWLCYGVVLFGVCSAADVMQSVGASYVPPMNADLVKQEQVLDRQKELAAVQTIVDTAGDRRKRRKKGVIGRPGKHKRVGASNLQRMLVHAAATQQAALDQGVFNLLARNYSDPLLTDKTVSLKVKKMPMKTVLQNISSMTDVQLVVDADVTGDVLDVRMHNIPLAAALRSLLAGNDPKLALLKEFKVLRVARLTAAKELLAGQLVQEREKDFVSSQYILKDVKWTEALKKQIDKLWEGVVLGSNEKQFFYMVTDETQNKVLFKTRKVYAEEFTRQLHQLDVRVPEIRIDARVVMADKNFDEAFGFNWSGVYNRQASVKRMDFASIGGFINTAAAGSPVVAGNQAITTSPTRPAAGQPWPAYTHPAGDTPFEKITQWALNFVPTGVKSAIAIPFTFGNRDMNTKRLTLELNASENRGESKTILKPSLLVHNDECAELLVGNELPVDVRVNETVGGAPTNVSTVRYKDIGVKLRVKPTVQPGQEQVFLDIFVENSQPNFISQDHNSYYGIAGGGGSSPGGYNYTIKTSRSQNRVLLKSGETTMIGGLMVNTTRHVRNGIPFLQDIPVLGWLFGYKQKVVVEEQLMIFITPTLVA